MTLRDLLRGRQILAVQKEWTVKQALSLMHRHHLTAVAVVSNDQFVGLFTRRDLISRVVAKQLDPATTPVGKVMCEKMRFVRSDAPCRRFLELLEMDEHQHLLVVEGDRLVGILSAREILKCVQRQKMAEKRYVELIREVRDNRN